MNKLAVRFGVSDVGLAKICERFDIPRPPQGHWARLAWNHKPERPPLPDPPLGVPGDIVIGVPIMRDRSADTPGAHSMIPAVEVRERLVDPHPVTTLLTNAAKDTEVDKFGRLLVGLSFCPEICVRRTGLPRTLLLLDALFKALTERGHTVEMTPWGLPPSPTLTVVVAGGGSLHLRVEEKLANKPHVPTADERDKQKRWGRKVRKYDPVADGELIFRVEGASWQFKGRKSWSDTKSQRMENQLGRIILTIEEIAAFNHVLHLEEEKSRRSREEQERRRLRGERLNAWRSWLATDLEEMASAWRSARRVIQFLDAFETKIPGERPSLVTEWLAAARNFASRLDPLSTPENAAKELEPSDEVLAAFTAKHIEAPAHDRARPRADA